MDNQFKIENLLAFNLLMWQIFNEYHHELDLELIGKCNDEYIREKSLFYLGNEIGWDELKVILVRKNTRMVFNRSLADVCVYYTDELKLKTSDDDKVWEKESGYMLYPNNVGEGAGFQIKGLHQHMSNFVLNITERDTKAFTEGDFTKLLRNYQLDSLFED